MADKVIRLAKIQEISQESRAQHVVMKFTGRVDGRIVRVEVELDSHAIQDTVRDLRNGAVRQLNNWQGAMAALGSEG